MLIESLVYASVLLLILVLVLLADFYRATMGQTGSHKRSPKALDVLLATSQGHSSIEGVELCALIDVENCI